MYKKDNQQTRSGFTLMEIVVSTTIFAFVSVATMAMFNYTLKINRRSEALRQATQGMRNFVEYLVKEIRNGEIDYGIINGNIIATGVWPANYCGFIGVDPPIVSQQCTANPADGTCFSSLYPARSNRLAFINNEGERKCIFFGGKHGAGTTPHSDNEFSDANGTIAQQLAASNSIQVLNPPNFRVENLMFIVRPTCDPMAKCTSYGNSYPKIQPNVQIMVRFSTQLPTGEKVTINYQTAVSINKYNYPNQN